jgi:hypothetical protein
MTRIADDFDAIRRRLAELANKPEKLTTITPANSPLHSPTQSPPTQSSGRTCRSCGATQAYIVDRRCWVCPRCGTTTAP